MKELNERYAKLYTFLNKLSIYDVRNIARAKGAIMPTTGKKSEIIERIVRVCAGVDSSAPLNINSGKGAPPKSVAKKEHLDAIDRIVNEIWSQNYYALPDREKARIVLSDSERPETPEYSKPKMFGIVDSDSNNNYFLVLTKGMQLTADIKIPRDFVRSYDLRVGDKINTLVEETENGLEVVKIYSINTYTPDDCIDRPTFEEFVPCYANEIIPFSAGMEHFSVIDKINPIGKGQRVLVPAPSASGKTVLLKQMVDSLVASNSTLEIVVLLVAVRPEEVAAYGEHCGCIELFATTFDDSAKKHAKMATLAFEHTKRLIESGKEVILLLDGTADLAYAFGENTSSGVSTAEIKKFLAIARNTENNGSVTIIATINTEGDLETGIYRDLKRTVNVELPLSREYCERCIYPPVDFTKSYNYSLDKILSIKDAEYISVIKNSLLNNHSLQHLIKLVNGGASLAVISKQFAD